MGIAGTLAIAGCAAACAVGPSPAAQAAQAPRAVAARTAARAHAAAALPPLHARVQAHAAGHGPSVSAALKRLLAAGAVSEASYRQYYNAYVAARHSLTRLSGTRHSELGAVIANLQSIAAAGGFSASRVPVLFLTLERNRKWWTTEPLLGNGERVTFPSSKLVWEYYAGQGLEIQWLATFGAGNGYYLSGHENSNLRQLAEEVIPLAAARAGGIAWEYLFRFDGGLPPWTSGLSQGTGLEMLARAYSRLKDPAFLAAAQQALGVFRTAPSQGVRVRTPAGALYAEYTYAPSDRILNGFIQALVGLYEYTAITKDPAGLRLFEEGDAEARAEVPHYDTGGWSLYDQYGESNLNYHELLTEFLQHLCEKTRKGPPYVPAAAPPPATGTTPGTGTTGAGGGTGTSATGASAHAGSAGTAIPGDDVYCTTAKRFTADLSTPPAVAVLTKKLRGGTRAGVRISLSKISSVKMIVRRGSKVVWTNGATLEHGRPRLLWVTPAGGGTFSVTITARDLAGNFSTASGTIAVSKH